MRAKDFPRPALRLETSPVRASFKSDDHLPDNDRVGCPRGRLESFKRAAAATFRSQNLSLPQCCARREFNRGEAQAGSAGGASKLHLFTKARRRNKASTGGFQRRKRRLAVYPSSLRTGALLCQIANAAARLSSMPRPANKATRTRADRARRNPGPKGQLAAVVRAARQGRRTKPQEHERIGFEESGSEGSTRGGSHEQHVKAGQQSHKNS